MTAAVVLFVVWFQYEDALTAWKRELDPLPFFTLLTLAGTVGIPTTPFYVLAGMVFGPAVALTGVGLAILGYLTFSFGVARGPLRSWSERIRIAVERRTQRGWLRRPSARIAVLRMMPGVPGVVKSYASASMGTSLSVYLLVSWPLSFGSAAALVLLGDAFVTRRPAEALPALLLLIPIAAAAYLFRRSRNSRSLKRSGLPTRRLNARRRFANVFTDLVSLTRFGAEGRVKNTEPLRGDPVAQLTFNPSRLQSPPSELVPLLAPAASVGNGQFSRRPPTRTLRSDGCDAPTRMRSGVG